MYCTCSYEVLTMVMELMNHNDVFEVLISCTPVQNLTCAKTRENALVTIY